MGTYDSSFGSLLGSQPRKRRVFFSFHYADVMRVNNVRLCGEFKTNSALSLLGGSEVNKRDIEGFYDFSLWEKRKIDGPEALKRLIREGVHNTSAICVLIGSQTYARPWVRYEIARSVIDERGLLAVHLNNLNHHTDRVPHPLGPNPLDFIGVVRSGSLYYLCEKNSYGSWVYYTNHTQSVPKPKYMPILTEGYVSPLSSGARLYDFVTGRGHDAIGGWIDAAAQAVGR